MATLLFSGRLSGKYRHTSPQGHLALNILLAHNHFGQFLTLHIHLSTFAAAHADPPQLRGRSRSQRRIPGTVAHESPTSRQTLIAKREEADGMVRYRFGIKLQGEGETVFFDLIRRLDSECVP